MTKLKQIYEILKRGEWMSGFMWWDGKPFFSYYNLKEKGYTYHAFHLLTLWIQFSYKD